MLNGLSLFSGIGGLDVALSRWISPIAYCEIDTYCQGILLSRMAKNSIATAPICSDILGFNGTGFSGICDIIYGGFPCQDISVAGHGKGLEGKRSGLFFEIVRLSKEIKPKFIFLENVPAITSRGGLQVVREIAEMGYDCRWCVISAESVGALHKRERFFLLAYSMRSRRGTDIRTAYGNESKNEAKHMFESIRISSNVPNSDSTGCNEERQPMRQEKTQPMSTSHNQYGSIDDWQKAVSSIRRTTDGIPHRVDRIRALGNAVVPVQAKEAFKILMGIK